MDKLLRVNLGQFSDDVDLTQYLVNGEYDVDSMINDFSSNQQGNENPEQPEQPETPEPQEGDPAPEPEPEPQTPEKPEQPQEPTPEQPEGDNDPEPSEPSPEPEQPTEKRTPDEAFAQMRRQLEQYEPIAKWVEDLATQQGFKDPQELIEAFQQRKLEQEAEAQGVPVDVYKRLHDLEKENKQREEQLKATQFNAEVEQVKIKYNLDDAAITEVFRFMGQRGYDAGDIPFEDAYVLANRDNLVKDAEERGRQTYLETKRQQQQAATPDAGTGAEDGTKGGNSLDYSSEGILNKFEELGIPID